MAPVSCITEAAPGPAKRGRSASSAGLRNRRLKVWGLAAGTHVATFTADQPLTYVAAASDCTFLAGDEGGNLHILDLVEPLPSPPERV
jgi:hypothetical protein